jgi:hypothetical protein
MFIHSVERTLSFWAFSLSDLLPCAPSSSSSSTVADGSETAVAAAAAAHTAAHAHAQVVIGNVHDDGRRRDALAQHVDLLRGVQLVFFA